MIPQHREEPLYQRELFRLASADCLRPGGVELTEGSRTALSASASGWRIWAAVRA